MVEQRADRSGQVLGPYQLIRLLGKGGFGEVYEADHRLLRQKRAIKLLLERHFHDPNQRERFLREARTLATLEYPNILPVLEVGEEGSMLYLVMPFYRRGTLHDLLKQRTTPLPLTEIERFLAQMCAAVSYAHTQSIAHLDLKPHNMLLHDDGRLIVSDFGLAHLVKQGQLEGGSSLYMGTPYYMAPEQFRGVPELRSDLYALGVILYQLLTNQHPFTGNAPEAVMMKHLLEAPPPLHATSPEAPVTLEPVIQKALEKKPEDRYATAEALLADFRVAVGGPSPQTAYPTTTGSSFAVARSQINNPAPILPSPAPSFVQTTLSPGSASNLTNTYQAPTGHVQTFYAQHQRPLAPPMPTQPELVTHSISRPPVSRVTITTCGISWVIFEIIMILIYINVSNLGHPLEDEIVWPILSLLSIALFFSWGWIMTQKIGKTDAGKISRSIGITAITLFGGPIYWGISFYQEGNTPGGYAPFIIGNAIEGILVGTILIAPVLLLVSWAVGSGATFLGGLIGKRVSRN